jgi:hypothetical protein
VPHFIDKFSVENRKKCVHTVSTKQPNTFQHCQETDDNVDVTPLSLVQIRTAGWGMYHPT